MLIGLKRFNILIKPQKLLYPRFQVSTQIPVLWWVESFSFSFSFLLFLMIFNYIFCLFMAGTCDIAHMWSENRFREPVLSPPPTVWFSGISCAIKAFESMLICWAISLGAILFFHCCHLERSVGGRIHVQTDIRTSNYFCKGKKHPPRFCLLLKNIFPKMNSTAFAFSEPT